MMSSWCLCFQSVWRWLYCLSELFIWVKKCGLKLLQSRLLILPKSQSSYPTKKWNSIIVIKWKHQWILWHTWKTGKQLILSQVCFPYLIIKMWLWQFERNSNIEMLSSSFPFQFCSGSKIFSTYFQNISYQFCITFVLITTSISHKFHDGWKSGKAD